MHIQDFKDKRVHFIGIGGISMSGLAAMLRRDGYQVTGSDMTESAVLDRLRGQGIPCVAGHGAAQALGAGLIVRTSAIKESNPELAAARAQNIPVMERGTLLGQLMQPYEEVICVSGSHGKTTVSSMISHILIQAGLDPTVHLGGVLPLIQSSTRVGNKKNVFVAEADEYTDSFLRFSPTMAVVLNIDLDHLDYFPDLAAIENSFRKFLALLPPAGLALVNGDDPKACRVLDSVTCPAETFGLGDNNTWQALDLTQNQGHYSFTLKNNAHGHVNVKLSLVGRHQVYNALASIAAAVHAGVSLEDAVVFAQEFQGAGRRFERAGTFRGAGVYHDYAHHPAEIKATLEAARATNPGQLLCAFQPHTFTRTKALFDDFVEVFDLADKVAVVDIFAAREQDPGDINAAMLVDAMAKRGKAQAVYAPDFDACAQTLRAWAKPGDIILTLGAGDIEGMSKLLVQP